MRRYLKDLKPPYAFAGVGDVHGQFEDLAAALRQLEEAGYPKPSYLLQAGDIEAIRTEEELDGVHGPAKYRKLGDFQKVMDGEIKIPPLFFVGGNHEPWPALDKNGSGVWHGDVVFLGRSGVVEVGGLGVAFLSGIYSPRVSEGAARDRRSVKERTYWVREELQHAIKQAQQNRVDVVITHDWPAGFGTARDGKPCGDDGVAELHRRARAPIALCGHMHTRKTGTVGQTEIHALDHIRRGANAIQIFWYDGKAINAL